MYQQGRPCHRKGDGVRCGLPLFTCGGSTARGEGLVTGWSGCRPGHLPRLRRATTTTGVLELTIHPHAPLTARFIPAVVSGTGQPIADRGAAARRAAAHYASLRACAQLAPQPT